MPLRTSHGLLDADHRESHLLQLIALANSSEGIHQNELSVIRRVVRRLGIDSDRLLDIQALADPARLHTYPIPEQNASRYLYLRDVYQVLFADGRADAAELTVVKEYARRLGFGHDTVEFLSREVQQATGALLTQGQPSLEELTASIHDAFTSSHPITYTSIRDMLDVLRSTPGYSVRADQEGNPVIHIDLRRLDPDDRFRQWESMASSTTVIVSLDTSEDFLGITVVADDGTLFTPGSDTARIAEALKLVSFFNYHGYGLGMLRLHPANGDLALSVQVPLHGYAGGVGEVRALVGRGIDELFNYYPDLYAVIGSAAADAATSYYQWANRERVASRRI